MEVEHTKTSTCPAVNMDTARAVHDSLRDAFHAENDRLSNINVKTQTLATVAAILFASLSLSSFTVWPSKILAVISFACGIISIWHSLAILFSRDLKEVMLSKLLNESELFDQPQFVLIRLARSYEEAINECRPTVNGLYSKLDEAIKLLRWSAIMALLAFISQVILGGIMNENNNNTQATGTQTTQSTEAIAPAEPTLTALTGSYGVQVVKKSLDASKISTRKPPVTTGENNGKNQN